MTSAYASCAAQKVNLVPLEGWMSMYSSCSMLHTTQIARGVSNRGLKMGQEEH